MDLTLTPLQDQGGDCLGIVPPDFLWNGSEELESLDHPFEDCLRALERQRQNERTIRVGPGGDEERDKPSAVGKIDMDMPEIRFEALSWKMAQRDEGLPLRSSVLEDITLHLGIATAVAVLIAKATKQPALRCAAVWAARSRRLEELGR